MKISMLCLAIAAVGSAGVIGVGQALATGNVKAAPKTLNIVMHDPGCHWFQVNGKLTKRATVAGRVRLVDLDEAALKVASRRGTRLIAVGKSLVLGHGSYVIMMVGQAVDDNYLRLTVR